MSFKLKQKSPLTDIKAQGYLYQHQKTGAQVFYIENDDPNRSFTISFNTPPYNDNGISHILEHSVLNGSKKFPTKEPFVDLVKGSMNTFLNAMTYSDKTVYPVASTNEKDFFNLMEVYLDAVFQPLLLENDLILKQEGWHYHLENSEDELTYRGVVYSEMKGSLASPDRKAYSTMQENMYEGTHLAYESGGTPQAIVSLDQAEFVDFYQKHYHPTNSLTVLYGDLDIEKALTLLGEYFDSYDRGELVDISIEKPNYPSPLEVKDTYSLAPGEDTSNKTYLAFGWDVVSSLEIEENFALDILSSILLGASQSPLKKAVLDSGLASEVYGGLMDTGYRKMFGVFVKGANPEDIDQIRDIIKATLEAITRDGIDSKLVEANVNRAIFNLRELSITENEPRGVYYSLQILSDWIYGGDPYAHFTTNEFLDKLPQKAREGYFENLIQKHLLDNQQRIELILEGLPGKNHQQEEKLAQELADYKASLSEDEVADLVNQTQALLDRQMSPDSPEKLATIPHIEKSDIKPTEPDATLTVNSIGEGFGAESYLSYEDFTAGIDYLNLYFEIDDLNTSQLQDLKLYSSLIQQLSTKNYNVDDLQTAIKTHTGSISSRIYLYTTKSGQSKRLFQVNLSALEDQVEKAIELVREILIDTRLDEEALVLSTLKRIEASLTDSIIESGHQFAITRALGQVHQQGACSEALGGFTYHKYIKDQIKSIEEGGFKDLAQRLSDVREITLGKNRLLAMYTGPKTRNESVRTLVGEEFENLTNSPIGDDFTFDLAGGKKEAFVSSQDINYVAIGSNASKSIDYQGSVSVAGNLVNYNYLWNELRVVGGAYGCGMSTRRNGQLLFYSYRDPNIQSTIDTFLNTPNYLSELDVASDDLLKLIIGVMSDLEKPLSPRGKAGQALSLYLTGLTSQEVLDFKEEVLNTKLEDIQQLSPGYQKALDEYSLAVVGSHTSIEEAKDIFDDIYYID